MVHYFSPQQELRGRKMSFPEDLPMEITPQELRERMAHGERVRLLDVREPWEHQTARIEGAELIPMADVPANLPRLDGEEAPLVIYCHHGIRSMNVAAWLRRQGVEHAQSLQGGIDRWSREIDPAVPRYA